MTNINRLNEKINFSILIPVYNVECFLNECITSVLKQTYKKFEIILIDDGSTDFSGEMCNEYAKKDIRIKVYHQKNQGLIMARRIAISKATGDFCLFLDSDDYWNNNLLEIVNQVILKNNCDLVIFRYNSVSQNGAFIREANPVFKGEVIFESGNKNQLFEKIIIGSDLNNLVCKAVKRTIIDDKDYSEYKNIKNGEDLLQSLPLLYNAEKIVYINKYMYNYRKVSNSITNIININFVRDVTTVRNVVLQYIKKIKIDNENNLKLFYNFYTTSILNYIIVLINSGISKKEKIDVLNEIKSVSLYIEALSYIDISIFSLVNRIKLCLLNNNCYTLLFVMEKQFSFIRTLKNLIIKK